MAMKNSSVVARDYGLEDSILKGIWIKKWIILYPGFDIYYTNVKIHRKYTKKSNWSFKIFLFWQKSQIIVPFTASGKN